MMLWHTLHLIWNIQLTSNQPAKRTISTEPIAILVISSPPVLNIFAVLLQRFSTSKMTVNGFYIILQCQMQRHTD